MKSQKPIHPRQYIPVLLAVVFVGALYFALTPGLRTARAALPLLARMSPAWAAGAACCQALVYVCVAGVLRAGLSGAASEAEGESGGPGFGALIPIGGAFLWANRALPGPAVAGLATLVFLLGRRRVPPAAAQAAAAVFYVADYVAFFVVGAALLLALAASGRLAALHPVVLGIAAGMIVAGMIAAAAVLRSPEVMKPIAARVARTAARFRRAPGGHDAGEEAASAAAEAVGRFYARWRNIAERPGPLVSACLWSLGMHLCEVATLICATRAFTGEIGFSPLRSFVAAGTGYVAANLAAIVSFLPAGLGFFEGAMGTALHLLGGGVTIPQAALATLLYRLLSVWLPLPLVLGTARLALKTVAGGQPGATQKETG